MLAQRQRRWTTIELALVQRLVFAGMLNYCPATPIIESELYAGLDTNGCPIAQGNRF